jgi:hypothetical protein
MIEWFSNHGIEIFESLLISKRETHLTYLFSILIFQYRDLKTIQSFKKNSKYISILYSVQVISIHGAVWFILYLNIVA